MPLKIRENVPLAPLTTLGVGGNARFYFAVESEEGLLQALSLAHERGWRVFILGGGSNLLVSDAGFDGLVIHLRLSGTSIDGESSDGVIVRAAAGEDWDSLVEMCVGRGLSGLECLSGIPGSVGATPIQNVGAYGQEVSDVITSVRCLDTATGQHETLSAEDCGFGYRTSIFNTSARDRYIVLTVNFLLQQNGLPTIEYADLVARLSGAEASLSDVRREVLNIRRAKSMVIDPSDSNSRSAGSFFKNPVIAEKHLQAIKSDHPGAPSFMIGDGYKIPAAWLIEMAGFAKGYRDGNVGISENHTLAIINRGHASAAEVLVLKQRIVDAVFAKFQIALVPEPVMLGF